MMIFAVIFFVPQALLFAELGAAFPQEGGPYYWTRLAFGHLAGAVNNFLYWITNPVWIGGTLAISCIGAVEVFFNNGNTVPTAVFYIIALAFVWLSIIAAITSFNVGKWLPTAGAIARFVLLALFIITVIVFAAKHGARFGTPVRVNVFSGVVATIVVILAQQITSGNAAKYFNAVLGVTISTTLISYLFIYPSLWKLRRSHPDTPRPFKMPWHRPLIVLLMILVAVAAVQLIAPGLGKDWFGPDFIPSDWKYSERFTYLWTELIPVLSFIVIGVSFWWMGRRVRAQAAEAEKAAALGTAPAD
jgi:amino acid transporter